MKAIFFLVVGIIAAFFLTACFVANDNSTSKIGELINQIEMLPSSKLPDISDFDLIFSVRNRVPSRGLKMGYNYNLGEGYEVVLFTDTKSFDQVNNRIDNIIIGKKNKYDFRNTSIFINKCFIKNASGVTIYLREWNIKVN